MRPVAEWDLDYILQISPGEYDWVEFKGRKKLDFTCPGTTDASVKDELAKQLSAFANSGGGTLVYGISDPKPNKPLSVDDGGVATECKNPNVREWLEDIIPNLVEFPLKKFNVYALTNAASAKALADNRCIILIEIPDSENAPHQSTRDHRYYARLGGKSGPISHRLVNDILHRRHYPIFNVDFKFTISTLISTRPQINPGTHQSVQLHAIITNIGKVYAKHLHFTLWFPVEYANPEDLSRMESFPNLKLGEPIRWDRDNRKRNANFTWVDPVLPELNFSWSFNCAAETSPENFTHEKLRWRIHCDNASSVSGEKLLTDIVVENIEKPWDPLGIF